MCVCVCFFFFLCFRFVKFLNVLPSLSSPILLLSRIINRKIAQRKQSKLPSHHDPIITRSCALEMSTSDPLLVETIIEIALLKEKMVEMIHIM